MRLRIHHIFDIIRDLGIGVKLEEHVYGHSYHIIADRIYSGDFDEIEIVISSDDVCRGCCYLHNGRCTDSISHRKDYSLKEEFNNYLDERIIKVLNIKEGDFLTIEKIIGVTEEYLKNIEYIYQGNDAWHTAERRENVVKGLARIISLQDSRV